MDSFDTDRAWRSAGPLKVDQRHQCVHRVRSENRAVSIGCALRNPDFQRQPHSVFYGTIAQIFSQRVTFESELAGETGDGAG